MGKKYTRITSFYLFANVLKQRKADERKFVDFIQTAGKFYDILIPVEKTKWKIRAKMVRESPEGQIFKELDKELKQLQKKEYYDGFLGLRDLANRKQLFIQRKELIAQFIHLCDDLII